MKHLKSFSVRIIKSPKRYTEVKKTCLFFNLYLNILSSFFNFSDEKNHPLLIHCNRGKVCKMLKSKLYLLRDEYHIFLFFTQNIGLFMIDCAASDRVSCWVHEETPEMVLDINIRRVPAICSG